MLIIFSGLPGTGKSTIARLLAQRLGAMHLRIDTIEQVLRACGTLPAGVVTEGYAVACAVAEDNLRCGSIVIADSVNPVAATREAWVAVANRAGATNLEVEMICSDTAEHRRRVECRVTDVPGLKLPTWQDVRQRRYEPWNRPHVVLDTASRTEAESVELLLQTIIAGQRTRGFPAGKLDTQLNAPPPPAPAVRQRDRPL